MYVHFVAGAPVGFFLLPAKQGMKVGPAAHPGLSSSSIIDEPTSCSYSLKNRGHRSKPSIISNLKSNVEEG